MDVTEFGMACPYLSLRPIPPNGQFTYDYLSAARPGEYEVIALSAGFRRGGLVQAAPSESCAES
jgi:hypothetical protein